MSGYGTYLTTVEAKDYLRFKSMKGLYRWSESHAVPRCRRGRTILFLKRDLDEAVGNVRHAAKSATSASVPQGTVGARAQEAR